eukprot:m.20622 g.20622  ORF g.20622 m.20622 type:complete len:254 (+) comp3811_c0_seq2:148-909(+)
MPASEEPGVASAQELSEVNGWMEEKEGRLKEMAGIEEEYSTLKERLYQQRLTQVQKLLSQLRDGAHPRYKQQKAELEAELDKQKANAEVRKAYRMVTLDHHTAFTTKRARQDYDFRVNHLKTRMIEKLRRELRQIETEKREINTPVAPERQPMLYRRPSSGGSLYPGARPSSTTPPKRIDAVPVMVSPHELHIIEEVGVNGAATLKRKRKTPVTSTQFPYVVYMLSDDEIARDLEYFRRFDVPGAHGAHAMRF